MKNLNKKVWNKSEIIAATKGEDISKKFLQKKKVTGISIDTRSIKKGDLFIALTGENFDGHDYAKYYESYFQKIKKNKLDVLEIGAFYGNAAAALFFYFKNSKIYSADIFPDLFSYKSERIKNFFVDSSSESSIQESINILKNNFDIIIEDASHSYKDQIISLFMLFPKLNSGGIFVTEELDFPDTRKDMNLKNQKPTLRDILLEVKSGNEFNNSLVSEEQKKYFLSNFNEIKICKGKFNEIAIIIKK